jgi:hypothetical protein
MAFRSPAEILVPDLRDAGLPQLRLEEVSGRAESKAYDSALPGLDELARAFDRHLAVGGTPRAVADEAACRCRRHSSTRVGRGIPLRLSAKRRGRDDRPAGAARLGTGIAAHRSTHQAGVLGWFGSR